MKGKNSYPWPELKEARDQRPVDKYHVRGIGKAIGTAAVALIIVGLVAYSTFATLKIVRLQDELNRLLRNENRITITNVVVEERLKDIGELATQAYEYRGMQTIKNVRSILGWNILGTENTVNLTYTGVIKVGFEVTEIHSQVNEASKKIYITLPDPKVLDSYIDLKNLKMESENNILNPINIENLTEYFNQIENYGLTRADEVGIFEKAEERMQLIVCNFLAVFSEYEVIFV